MRKLSQGTRPFKDPRPKRNFSEGKNIQGLELTTKPSFSRMSARLRRTRSHEFLISGFLRLAARFWSHFFCATVHRRR